MFVTRGLIAFTGLPLPMTLSILNTWLSRKVLGPVHLGQCKLYI